MRFIIRKNRRRPVYEVIGDEVSVEGAICQAAQSIDIAGKMATEAQDSERLLQAAEWWTKLADFIVALSEHQDKTEARNKKTEVQMGFRSEHEITAEEEKNVRDEREDSDPSEGGDGLHSQYGKFRVIANRRGGRGFRAYWRERE